VRCRAGVAERVGVGVEDRVQLRGLGPLRDVLRQLEAVQLLDPTTGMPPRGGDRAAGRGEQEQNHLVAVHPPDCISGTPAACKTPVRRRDKGGSTMSISGSITIARSPEGVFAYLGDFARRPEWQLEVKETKVLTDGPTRVGTEVEEVRQMGRRTGRVRWRVTSHEPPRRSTFESYESTMLRPSGVITVEPSGSGSV